MKEERIVLGRNLSGMVVFYVLFLGITVTAISISILTQTSTEWLYSIPIFICLISIGLFLCTLPFIKYGLLYSNNTLYKAKFLGNWIIRKVSIKVISDHEIVLMKFNMVKTSKMGFNPATDLSNRYFTYELHILNNAHTNRNRIYSIKDKNLANKTGAFIAEHCGIVFYNPQE